MENKICENLRGRLMRRIAGKEQDIATCTEKFSEDYEKFLEWYAEDLYKYKKELCYYNSILTAIETDDLSFLKGALSSLLEDLGTDLLCGSLRRSSTSSFVNLAHVLDLEVKQKVLGFCKKMQNEIVRMENQ